MSPETENAMMKFLKPASTAAPDASTLNPTAGQTPAVAKNSPAKTAGAEDEAISPTTTASSGSTCKF